MSDPIGISDASIAVLAPLAPRIKLDRPSGVQCLKQLPRNTALLVIDMQIGFDDPSWGRRNNPDAEANVAALLAGWRAARAPVIHVHHDSPHTAGRLRPGTPGNSVKPEARPLPHERVFRKTVNSAFIGTALEPELRALDMQALAIVGLTTNHCISTTARMASNLGFATFVATSTERCASRTTSTALRSAISRTSSPTSSTAAG
jgi:nicotinamidase-related amidase